MGKNITNCALAVCFAVALSAYESGMKMRLIRTSYAECGYTVSEMPTCNIGRIKGCQDRFKAAAAGIEITVMKFSDKKHADGYIKRLRDIRGYDCSVLSQRNDTYVCIASIDSKMENNYERLMTGLDIFRKFF